MTYHAAQYLVDTSSALTPRPTCSSRSRALLGFALYAIILLLSKAWLLMSKHIALPQLLCKIPANNAGSYVKDILKSTSRSADQVIIEPNGTWKSHEKPKSEPQSNGRQGMSFADDDDDDDLVEVTKTGQAARLDTPLSYRTPNSAPMVHSREQSTLSSGPAAKGSSSGKRPISAVIDLTSSGDEDDEPLARAAKRQFNGYSTPSNALPAYRPGQPTNGYPRP